ncbi:SGNH/GDSL hydrolase family protein [Janthinobacterium sp. CG_23.4]|uniref:SGNH/GDSL hydrolase family protein n=1 Tax=Janthinobacterium sp. CG_23.4 TaxID=2760707 RepID=UPI00247477AD|nr:SGNH/GDSL hydrolase family protein [Janthinobacterium sp. CG_23.4]MDH6157421.1 lysophospholipase L1-like esterase [Janthinobacterium sp. CG_23.4]
MTVRLLKPYAQRPVGAIATFEASTEAGMIASGQASANLTGGFEYFIPRPGLRLQAVQIAVGSLTLRAAEQAPVLLPEGQVLNISGSAGTAGVVYRLDPVLGGTNSLQSWPVGAGALAPIGPYAGEQQFLVACSVGSVAATAGDAVLVPTILQFDGYGAPLAIPGAGVQTPQFYGSNVAIMGDSIAQQSTSIIAGSLSYNQRGPVCVALSYLGWSWNFEPTDNVAVYGSTIDAIIATQLPALAARHATRRYSRVFLSCGTNDTNSGLFTISQIKANYSALFQALRAMGIIPVHTGIRPRGNDAATTAAKQQNQHLNEWLYQLSLSGTIEFIPVSEVYGDNTTAFGNCIPALMYDSVLHPNGRGAWLEGMAIANYYIARGIQPQLKFATLQSDIFDRVNNPTGVCFNIAGLCNPLMQGGTTTPTGMTTAGGSWSKAARALANGQSRSDPSCIMTALTTHYLYDDFIASGNWTTPQLQPGDILEGRAKVVIANGVNLQFVSIRANINDGTAARSHYGLFTDSTSIPDGNHTLHLKTPRFVVPPYSGSGNASMFMRAEVGTLAGGSGTMTVQGFEMRKVG